MGTVLWRLQSGIERTLEATDLSSPNTRGLTQGTTARQSYRKADFSLPEGSAHWASWLPRHPWGGDCGGRCLRAGHACLSHKVPTQVV